MRSPTRPKSAKVKLNAFYQANAAGLLPGQLGGAYFIPTAIVSLLLITHGLMFRVLLQSQRGRAVASSGYCGPNAVSGGG
jgi:hypothetical protein